MNMIRRAGNILAMALSVLTIVSSSSAFAQAQWPDRPVRIVVPFAPGGSNDVMARRLAMRLSEKLGQPVVVDNRAGGGSVVGTGTVINAAPDGYTLLFVSNSLATTAAAQKLPYDPVKGLVSVSLVAKAPMVVLTRADFPSKSMPELIAYAKANPSKLNYGTAGRGDTNQLATEVLSQAAGIKMVPVGYKGMAPAQIDLLAGRLDVMLTTMASIRGTAAEKLPMLAFTSAARSPDFPTVPTVKEATGLDYVVDVWWGLFAPAGIPGPVLARLNTEVADAIKDPAFAEFLRSIGAKAEASTPAAMHSLLAEDVKRFTQTAERAGIRDN